MSSKNTPINTKTNKLNNLNSNVFSQTPDSVRKRVLSSKQKSNVENFLHKKIEGDIDLNTAFSVGSTIVSKRSTTPVSKLKYKSSTALNACYTPSSLYRSANLTPTPVYKSLISSSKLSGTPKDRNCNQKFESKVGDSTPECFSKVKFDSARKFSSKISEEVKLPHKDGEASNLKVAVRIRPLNTKECLNSAVTNCVSVAGEEIIINGNLSSDSAFGTKHSFFYDHVFWSCNSEDPHYADQNIVFKGTGLPLIEKAFEGYNACLFAYGQTGSGKSYSMMGIEEGDTDDINANPDMGIIPRFCNELFNRINLDKNKIEAEVEISYFEIYNEKIHDLLSVASTTKVVDGNIGNCTQQKNALKVREHPVWGPYVVDLSTHPVDSYLGLRNWLALGNSQRATAATGMNDKSSRSHSIFNIILNLSEVEKIDNKTEIKQTRRSKISLVDLAGSERISHKSASGERVREGVSINKSLLTLGKVIAALADFKKGVFVPYRESVLTWLLRESLGGNSKTVMLATISPASIHLDETLATLRYACQARTIVNRVKVNEDPHDKIIRELREEVERLQALRQDYERQKRFSTNDNLGPRKIIIETSVDESEVEALRQQLAETEKELTKAQKSWMERLKEAEDLRKNEIKILKRKGLAMELSIEHKQACLVNLAADPILSGTLLYILPPGTVLIGRSRPTAFSQPDIVLEGPLVAFQHCSIKNDNGKLYIIPENKEFETYLNGELVTDVKQMFHGDRLVVGGSHYFRISNPNCVNKHKNVVVDYQLAHQEILQKQEEQLRKELEEEKKIALDQIEKERLANEKMYSEKMEMLELEKFKFKCNKELLESEQKALEEKKQDEKFEYTPFKSTLLDDIKRIMQRPTDENLHQIQLKVKEATRRCRDLGLKYDFKQSQVLDEFGIFRAVVTIFDKGNLKKAEWPTARLDVWLDMMRENENQSSENIFNCVDVEWLDLSQNIDESINDSLNSSRISLNLSAVKDAMLQEPKIHYKSLKESNKENLNKTAVMNSSFSAMDNIRKTLIYDDEDIKRSPDVNVNKKFSSPAYLHLLDIHKSTLKLRKLCEQTESDENYDDKKHTLEHFKKSIEKMENIIFDLKATLMEQKLSSPTKTPKSVRFLLD